MAEPYLIYQQRTHFFTLDITNISELTVAQIQTLESFTHKRNGIFDFKKAQIKITKRIELHHLTQLFNDTQLNPYIKEFEVSDLQAKPAAKEAVPIPIGFGKHRGTLYEDLPAEYLQWLRRNYKGSERDFIMDELKRRGLL